MMSSVKTFAVPIENTRVSLVYYLNYQATRS